MIYQIKPMPGLGNFTRIGMRRLGDIVTQWKDSQGLTYEVIIEKLRSVGHETNVPKLQRLMKATDNKPDAGLLLAIARLEEIKCHLGRPYTLEEFLLIACELMQPQVEGLENRLAAIIEERITDWGEAKFLQETRISSDSLTEIRCGRLPSFEEFVKLAAVLTPDRSADTLLKMTGVNYLLSVEDRQQISAGAAIQNLD